MKLLQRIYSRFGLVTKQHMAAALRSQAGNFMAALSNRLTGDWTTSTLASDSQARMDLCTLRARCRDLRDNNDHGKKFVGMVKTNVLGDQGIHFRSGVKEPDRVQGNKLITGQPDVYANKVIEDGWHRFGRQEFCTVHGNLTWCEVQNVVLGGMPSDGEYLLEKIITDDRANPFSLRLMESDYLDDQFNGTAENGNEVRMGVEVDQNHRRVAYHLWNSNPNDSFNFRRNSGRRRRVPASQIIHLGLSTRAEQTRFLPWMATAAFRLHMIGEYEKAETVAKRIEASKMGFLIPDESGPAAYTGEQDGLGNVLSDVEPGALQQLPRGYKVETVDWQRPASNFAEFVKASLRGVASGLNVSYNDLANDMESVNFASGKLGLMYQREVFKALQGWFIEKLCQEVFASWLKTNLDFNTLASLPAAKFNKFNAPVFKGRRWASIDPQKDVDADIRKLNSGLTSHTQICSEQNIDFPELCNQIKADRDILKALGITTPELESKLPSTIQAKEVDASDLGQSMEEVEDKTDS